MGRDLKQPAKLRVAVLMGGKSPEYEISLISGKEVVRSLPKKYHVSPVIISRDGKRWLLTDKQSLLDLDNPLKLLGTGKEAKIKRGKSKVTNQEELSEKIDVCFIAMHGPYGEDGTVQGLLELADIPYTGPGVLASAIGMDKLMFRKILASQKIPVPKYVVFYKGQKAPNLKKELGNLPYFVKPNSQGSSVGTSIVRRKSDFKKALQLAFNYGEVVLVDKYIKGKEITCGVLGNKEPYALPLVEIEPLKGEFFNYDSKYTESGANEIVPARLDKKTTEKIQKMAIEVYKLINAKGFSRVDFILSGEKPYVLEINTIPGLTPMSLLPKAAKQAGLTYSRLLDEIIKYAAKK